MICLNYFDERIHDSFFHYRARVSNRDLMKFQANLLMAILRKQSGISDVIIPETWLDLESSPIPLTEELSWHKWAAKAKELYRIGETAAAAVMFECSIKSLKQKLEANILAKKFTSVRNDRTELVTLFINLSKIYIEDTAEIIHGTERSFDFPTFCPADCLIHSFRHAIQAVELQINWTQSIEMLEIVFERLRCYFDDGSFKLALAAQISQERMGLHPKIFQQKSQYRSNFPCVDSKKVQINLLIKEMQGMRISNETRARLTELRKNISLHAMEAAQEILRIIPETSTEHPNTDKFGFYLDHLMQLFEYPVQFALMAMHWNLSDDENHQVYSLALDRLENAISDLKKHVNEGPIVSEQKAQERPGTKKNWSA